MKCTAVEVKKVRAARTVAALAVAVLVAATLATRADSAAVSAAHSIRPECQQKMNAWCNSPTLNEGCLHAMEADGAVFPLLARNSSDVEHGPDEWRCYSPDALDKNNQSYAQGTHYCTRPAQLEEILYDCESNSTFVDVFTPGELGYPCIRIPSLILHSGNLLAFAECRNWTGDGCYPSSDLLDLLGSHARAAPGMNAGPSSSRAHNVDYPTPGNNNANRDLCMKISSDGGQSWSPLQVIARNAAQPSPSIDAATGNLVMNFNRLVPGDNMQMISQDGGISWSTPVSLSPFLGAVVPSDVGPGVGITLSVNAAHKGRMLFVGHHGAYQYDSVWYTDDGGKTYNLSETSFPKMDEAQLVELSNGSVMVNMRNNHLMPCKCRGFAISNDGGASFGPIQFADALISPVCMATIIRAQNNNIYFANPASTTGRVNGVLRRSPDGVNWTSSHSIFKGSYAYSCLSLYPGDASSLGLLFETSMLSGCSGESCRTVFARVPTNF